MGIKKEDLKQWAINKWFDDRMAARWAIMDALDGMGKPAGMSRDELKNMEILDDQFWEGEKLEDAWQEYLEQRRIDRDRIGVALRLKERFGEDYAMKYILRLHNRVYSRLGEDLLDLYFRKAQKVA